MPIWRITATQRRRPEDEAVLMERLIAMLPNLREPVREVLADSDRHFDDLKAAFGDPVAIMNEMEEEVGADAAAAICGDIEAAIRDAAESFPDPEDVDAEARHAGYEIARFVVNAVHLYHEEALATKACEIVFVETELLLSAYTSALPGTFLRDVWDSLLTSVALKRPEVAIGTLLDRISEQSPIEIPSGLVIAFDNGRERVGCCKQHGYGEPRACPACSVISPNCALHVVHMVLDHRIRQIPSVES